MAKWVEQLPEGPDKDNALSELALASMRKDKDKDPLKATELAMRLPEGRARDHTFERIAQLLFAKTPATAKEWAEKLPQGDDRINALSSVAAVWACKDPAEASRWIEKEITNTKEKEQALASIATTLAKNNTEKAIHFVETQIPESNRFFALTQVFETLHKINPVSAKEYLVKPSLPQETKDKLLKKIEKK